MARKIQAVLHSLARIRVDQTTEEQLINAVPYLARSERDWQVDAIVQRAFYVEISNESDRMMQRLLFGPDWLAQVAHSLGYRFIRFDASVLVQDGKVSRISYGWAKTWGRPVQLSYIISAKSVHGFWMPYQQPFAVTSEDDESPQFRVEQVMVPTLPGHVQGLKIAFTNDASPAVTERAFQLNLNCFWSLRGCDDARDIAPRLWEDSENVKRAALERLQAGKCPDSVIEGRMRYLPDISVFLLEVAGSRRVDVNEQGAKAQDWFTDYKLKEIIRGRSAESWKNVRRRQTIPSPSDPTRTIANPIWPPTEIGSEVLLFGNLNFYSCRVIPATPSALEIIRNIPTPPKRPEDMIQTGLM